MSESSLDDKALLEGKLSSAMDEAWSKVNKALEQTSRRSEKFEKEIWMAAEAVEYSSLLFNLTYGLEDIDPGAKDRKNEDPVNLVRDSLELLKQARETRRDSSLEAYTKIRTAAHYLKRAYLDELKKAPKKSAATSAVRSKP